jgi:CHAT domain
MSYFGLFTSANPRKDLPNLVRELENITNSSASAMGFMETRWLGEATKTVVYNAFGSEIDVRIFHFSGHAGEGKLLFEKGDEYANQIAGITEFSKNLHLVFLNGCGTYELVDAFLDAGARVVIATHVPVFDSVACAFSSYFYQRLFDNGDGIAKAFDKAKGMLSDEVNDKIEELSNDEGNDDDDVDKVTARKGYKRMLEDFKKADLARSIVTKPVARGDEFEWSIHFRRDISEEERKEDAEWTVKITEPPPQKIEYDIPGIELLKSLAGSANDIWAKIASELPPPDPNAKPKPEDPRHTAFKQISQGFPNLKYWGSHAAPTITSLQALLLLPLQKPFEPLMAHCKNSDNKKRDPQFYRTLLELQVAFYKTFIRTATAIMISDFFECFVIMKKKEQATAAVLKKIFKVAIDENGEISGQFRDLLEADKSLFDLKFDVQIMRNISSCLTAARQAAEQAKLDTEPFIQFVTEYNVPSNPAVAKELDEIHKLFIKLDHHIEKKDLARVDDNWLKKYCDKAEGALIRFYKINAYVLAYEMVTVGRVEAIRTREKFEKFLVHELYDVERMDTPHEIPFSEEFGENFSVVLAKDKKEIPRYLSLSPFIINLATFIDEPISVLYFFNGKEKGRLHYIDLAENEPGKKNLTIRVSNNTLDHSLLQKNITFNVKYDKLDGKARDVVHHRFTRANEQYIFLEGEIMSVI